MKTLFVYPNLGGSVGFNIGLAMLSAQLKERSHKTKLIHLNEGLGFPLDLSRIEKIVLDYNPGLIGISANTNQYKVSMDIAKFIKSKKIKAPIVVGGIHPTISPEETLNNPYVDLVVLGEGEGAIVDLATSLEKGGEGLENINNLWFKKNGVIKKNNLRKFSLLDSSPFMDVDLYENFKEITDLKNGWAEVILGRGCPFSCSYCFNEKYRKIYRKWGVKGDIKNYIRTGDHDLNLQGIKKMKDSFKNINCFSFVDDDFLVNKNVLDFIKKYKQKIDLPFVINTTVQSINEKNLEVLKAGGCDLLRIGVESGNEKLREQVLNRHIKNEKIIKQIQLARNKDLKVLTYNMIGLPNETFENIVETLKINLECGADLVKVSTFYPYRGTKIYSYCKDLNLINESSEDNILTYFDKSVLNFDKKFKTKVNKIQKYFDVYLNYYDERLTQNYQEIISKIEQLAMEEIGDPKIEAEIKEISESLSVKGIEHYALKYTSFLAAKVP